MSLFKQLQKLYRPDRFQHEDYLTEIVAQVLQDAPEFTLAWLHSLKVTDLKNGKPTIRTQLTYDKLPHHDTDSRPDIAITIVEGDEKELVLIESKVGSVQGDTQLRRYADHLASEKERKGFKKATLLFITRDYEETCHPRPQDSNVSYRQTRWFEFYNKLKTHLETRYDGLAKQLKLFMEENRMSLGNQFRSTDLVAMENFLSAKALMSETLAGEVSINAWMILGTVSNLTNQADKELREYSRYTIFSGDDRFGCLIGYFLPHERPDQPVWVGVEFYSQPGAGVRREVIQAFRGWVAKTDGAWTSEHLDNETEWAYVRKRVSIQSLMGGGDHVRAIKDYLLQSLEEVKEFKKTYPGLPWESNVPNVKNEA